RFAPSTRGVDAENDSSLPQYKEVRSGPEPALGTTRSFPLERPFLSVCFGIAGAAPVCALAGGEEGSQCQDDGQERRDLQDRPHRLPLRKPPVDLAEDRLFGYPGSQYEQVRGRTGRRENVGRRERCGEVGKRSSGCRNSSIECEGGPECNRHGRSPQTQGRIDQKAGPEVGGP